MKQFCADNDILVQAYSPLGSASGVQKLFGEPTIQAIAKETHKTIANVLIRWSLQNECCKNSDDL
jgi:diketogulonate reductase-like aldo/keto reductase